MLFLEVAALWRLNINHSNHPVLGDQWDSEFGANVRHRLDVVSFLGDVIDQDGAAFLDGAPGNTFADLDTNFFRHLAQVANLKSESELLGTIIQQQDGKDLIVDDALYHLGHTL